MANFSVSGVSIRGISACVPKNRVDNKDFSFGSMEESQKFIDATGIRYRRVSTEEICTSDLCFEAANTLIEDLGWEKSEVQVLVFVSQTPDYIFPVTSCILQDRLGLPQSCLCFDITLGCSGFVYGLSSITTMMTASGLKKGILLAGDTVSKICSPTDKSTTPLFGDCGTATALEIDKNGDPIFFNLGTNGSGYKAIIIPDGGSRNPVNANSLEYELISDGISRNRCQISLDGMDVFSFGISQAPKTVNELLTYSGATKESFDYYFFHQANQMMNNMIVKKLGLEKAKVPYSLYDFGNTSSATIPLTMVTSIQERLKSEKLKHLLCGFGVGLSWGTVQISTERIVCSQLIEI